MATPYVVHENAIYKTAQGKGRRSIVLYSKTHKTLAKNYPILRDRYGWDLYYDPVKLTFLSKKANYKKYVKLIGDRTIPVPTGATFNVETKRIIKQKKKIPKGYTLDNGFLRKNEVVTTYYVEVTFELVKWYKKTGKRYTIQNVKNVTTITAKSNEDLENQILAFVRSEYPREDSYCITSCISHSYTLISKTEVERIAVKLKADVPLRQASPATYDCLNGIKQFTLGQCVYDALTFKYGDKLKRITKDYILNFVNSTTDRGVISMDDGITAREIHALCETNNISCYAIDDNNRLLLPRIKTSGRNYPPLVFYAIDSHMYLVDDKEEVAKLIKTHNERDNYYHTNITKAPKTDSKAFDDLEKTTFYNHTSLVQNAIV